MENQIFAIESTFYKSLAIKGDELWLSNNKESDFGTFENGIKKTGLMKAAYAYPLASITEISYNEASERIKLRYKDDNGKLKKLNIKFDDQERSNRFGAFLGEKLGMTRSQEQERQWKPLLTNLFYLIVAIGGTYALAMIDDTTELTDGGSRKSRSRGAILKMIVDTIGQTGVIVIGSLISLYLIYRLYTRFQQPANEVVYQKP